MGWWYFSNITETHNEAPESFQGQTRAWALGLTQAPLAASFRARSPARVWREQPAESRQTDPNGGRAGNGQALSSWRQDTAKAGWGEAGDSSAAVRECGPRVLS